MTVAYLTHPLGERDADWGSARGDNLANAMQWFRFLKDVTQWAVCYPAMAYIAACDDVYYRRSMLTDSVEIMSRCDVLVLVGDRLSPHMRIELEHAKLRAEGPMPCLALLDLGASPPWERKDEVGLEIARRATALGL